MYIPLRDTLQMRAHPFRTSGSPCWRATTSEYALFLNSESSSNLFFDS